MTSIVHSRRTLRKCKEADHHEPVSCSHSHINEQRTTVLSCTLTLKRMVSPQTRNRGRSCVVSASSLNTVHSTRSTGAEVASFSANSVDWWTKSTRFTNLVGRGQFIDLKFDGASAGCRPNRARGRYRVYIRGGAIQSRQSEICSGAIFGYLLVIVDGTLR